MSDRDAAPARAATAADAAAEPTRARPLRYRVAFFLTAAVTLALVVTLPFSVKSVVDDILGSATGRVVQIRVAGAGPGDKAGPHGPAGPHPNHPQLPLGVGSRDAV